jgi:hypothetical protein
LTPGEEEGIIRYIYIQMYIGYPCTGPIILGLVHYFLTLQDPTAKPPSPRYLQNLLKKHPEIYSVVSKPMDIKRKAVHDKSVIAPWYKKLEQLTIEYNCSPNDILNFDEIGIQVACPAGITVYIPSGYKNIKKHI